MPPPVKAVDEWLLGYSALDVERVVKNTFSADRELVRAGVEEMKTNPNGPQAMMLPPRPLEHEIIDITSKDKERGRWVTQTKITMKNPLPYMSKRVGHVLPEIPEVRGQWRRFLSVKEGEQWGVKLDLLAVQKRAAFVQQFIELVSKRQLDEAEATLANIPLPPDEANALKKSDRLPKTLREDLKKARDKVAARLKKTKTSTKAAGSQKEPAKAKTTTSTSG